MFLKSEEMVNISEIKLYQLTNNKALELPVHSGGLEKSLQHVFESNLETILGVKFLQSEYSTGKVHGGRIDTLGIDENGFPVIIEYKRATNENVINQGLFYLDWLLDHKADFKLLVMEKLGKEAAEMIDWTAPRLICIASDFTKYDKYAVKQINRNIDLLRYRKFGHDLLSVELVHSTVAKEVSPPDEPKHLKVYDKPVSQLLEEMDDAMKDIFESLRAYILALGDDVQEKQLKLYIAYRRIKNFASIVIQKKNLLLYLKIDPDTITLEKGFSRDVRGIGHWGTGDLEISITTKDDLRKAEPLIERSYEGS